MAVGNVKKTRKNQTGNFPDLSGNFPENPAIRCIRLLCFAIGKRRVKAAFSQTKVRILSVNEVALGPEGRRFESYHPDFF